MIFKFVCFFDSECAVISHSTLHKDYEDLLDCESLTRIIEENLKKMDFKFVLFSNQDFFNKNLSTEELLNKLKDENECTVGSTRAEDFCLQSAN